MRHLTIGLVVSAVVLWALPGLAQTTCTDASLNGTCIVQLVGAPSTTGVAAGHGPLALVGSITFNGAGALTADVTINENGTPYADKQASGTYTVDADCQGDFSVAYSIPGGTTVTKTQEFHLTPSGEQIRFISVGDSEVPLGGRLNEVSAGICRFQ